jgi:hypothetical protein
LAELHGPDLIPVGFGPAFSPALSPLGALATVALQGGKPTPGITKPHGFQLQVAPDVSTKPRSRYTTTSSLGNPVWTGPHTVVVAASNGPRTTLLTVDTTSGSAHPFATLAVAGALSLTAGAKYVTAGSQGRFTVLPLTGGRDHAIAADWMPLCWTGPSTLIAARGRALAAITVSASRAAEPEPFAQVPAGLQVIGGDCSRVSN